MLKTRYTSVHGITFLKDIFEKGDVLDQVKREKIEMAKGAIQNIAIKRSTLKDLGFSPKEFQFA